MQKFLFLFIQWFLWFHIYIWSNDILKLNNKNPGTISLVFEEIENEYKSSAMILADKILLISHDGNPKYKAAKHNVNDRKKMFNSAHPIPRGDILVEALKVIRDALTQHIHGYSGLPADKSIIIKKLEELNFDGLLQKNILIN